MGEQGHSSLTKCFDRLPFFPSQLLFNNDYLQQVRGKLEIAEAILRRSGVSRDTRHVPLTLEQKRIFGDLKSLFGYTTQHTPKTDPISPNSLVETICE